MERRTLLTTTIPETTTLAITNQSQFGPGTAVVSGGDYFLGDKNFDTGTKSIGGFVYPLGVKTGAQASLDLNGTVGLDMKYFVNSGSLNANYTGNLTQSFNNPTAPGPVSVNTTAALSNGSLSTQSPTFGASADAQFDLGGSFTMEGAAFGADPQKTVPFSTAVDQELFSFNRDNSQSLNVLGQPVSGSASASVQLSEVPPVALDASISNTNNPVGTAESLDLAFTEENTGGGASANLGSASQSVPVLQLSANQTNANGVISASTTDSTATQLATVQMQLGALLGAELGLPPAALTSTTYSLGPASFSVTPVSFQVGPNLYANQSLTATPVSTITYVFDHPVMVGLGGAQPQLMSQVTFTPGESLNIAFQGTPIKVTPYLNLDLQIHNTIKLDLNVSGTLTVGSFSAGVSAGPFSASYQAGPLVNQTYSSPDLAAITAYDKTFDVNVKSQAMASFTIGGNFQPLLSVTSNDDSISTGGTLRAAVNSANALAAKNGAKEGPDVITLGPGTYNLTSALGPGQTDDGIQGGNLFVTDPNLTIVGAGQGQTIINASGLGDRVFQVASGGGLHLEDLTIEHGDVTTGVAGTSPYVTSGGGILNQGTLTLDHVDVTDNAAGIGGGGGIYSIGGNLTIHDSTIDSNTTQAGSGVTASSGGGLSVFGGSALITGTMFENNSAKNTGGGLYLLGVATVVGSTFDGNSASQGGAIGVHQGQLITTNDDINSNSASIGGGIYFDTTGLANNQAFGTITGTTFRNNAASEGAAVADENTSKSTSLVNSTVVGSTGDFGALLFVDGAGGTLTNSTVVNNQDTGIFVVGGSSLSLENNIVAGNTDSNAPADVTGTVTSIGHNLIGNGSGSSGLTNGVQGDLVGTASAPIDPKLGPLQNNGGITLTMAPLAGSPAIDAGNDNNAPSTDQRGFARPAGAHVDIGAVEYTASPLTVSNLADENVTVTTASSGTITVSQNATLRDAVNMFNAQGGANEIDLVAGTYSLTRSASLGELGGTFGDLVVANEDLTIRGAGVGKTIIDASALGDRVFDVLASGKLRLIGVTITGGDSSHDGAGNNSDGGGIRNQGTLTLDNVDVTGNKAGDGDGGGVASLNATTTIENSTIENNSATVGGGLDGAGGTILIAHSAFNNNTATHGGAIQGEGPMTIETTTFNGNSATSEGGAILALGGQFSANDDSFTQNKALAGAAIYFHLASGDSNPNTITASTFSGNVATQSGGAIDNASTNALTLSDCTLAANTAESGGAIYNSGSLTINSSTFSGNQSNGSGNDIRNVASTPVSINSTLVAHSAAAVGSDLAGTIKASYSLIQAPPKSGLTADSHTLLSVDPLLAPLGNYGGPTQTMALLPGSPAIDAGPIDSNVRNDQRGLARRIGAALDIGAFESNGFALTTSSGGNQSATLNAAFAAPLVVTVRPVRSQEPVAGGQISFSAPASGASASLSAGTVTLGADGTASVTASANTVVGRYRVTASTTGAFHSTLFDMSNKDTAPVVSDTGGPYTVGSEGELFLSAQVLDPDPGQTLTVSWDVNGDGTPDATATAATNGSTVTLNTMLTNAQLEALGLFNGGSPFTVNVTASDGILTSAAATTTLTAEQGPEGGMKSDGAAFAGQPVNVQIFVPATASAQGPRQYSIALDQNDLATTYAAASVSNTQSFTFDAPGTYTVYGRMFQPDGAFSDYTTTIDVYASSQQNALFVDRVYNDLLGRNASPNGSDGSGANYWAGQLQNGVSHENVALAIMSGGDIEYDAQLVTAAFQQYLHRNAEPQAVAYFAPFLKAGLTVEQLDVELVSSDEYLSSRGGGTNDGFLDALYQDALGRSVDATGRSAFDAMLAAGASRAQVADLVFGSTEYQQDLVENMFESLLDRPADPTSLAYFTGELSSGMTDQQVMAQIIGSEEFAPLA